MGNSHFDLDKLLRFFKKGNIVYLEGDPAVQGFWIKTGAVELRRRFNSNELIIGTCGPGDFFGVVPTVDRWVYTETAEVSQDSEIFILKPADLEQLVINNPSIGFDIVNNLSNQLRELDNKLDKLSKK